MLRQASVLAEDDHGVRERLGAGAVLRQAVPRGGRRARQALKNEQYAERADLLPALGECQLQTGKLARGPRQFETATQLDPPVAELWLGLAPGGDARPMTSSAPELALKKSLSLDPAVSEANLLLGYLRLQQNRLDGRAGRRSRRPAPWTRGHREPVHGRLRLREDGHGEDRR